MKIKKSQGQTSTEKWLSDLCDQTFLKLWSYSNPFNEEGKELCDLLAVFENHIFIFFDRKSLKLDPSSSDVMMAWNRWKKETIDKQIKTAKGAERYIRSGKPIFLDPKKTVGFPINYDISNITIHKIIVAHGAEKSCKSASKDNVSGSLGVVYSDNISDVNQPFVVDLSRLDPVHILDSSNIEIILKELDTFYDFKSYLVAKEKAIKNFSILAYCGEEDLLAHYFLNVNRAGEHFIGTNDRSVNALWIGEGEWQGFIAMESYQKKKKADDASRLWDELIQKTCGNALEGVLLGDADVYKGDSAIREMAKEPRFFRRELSALIVRAIQDFPENGGGIARKITSLPSFYKEKAYIFFQLWHSDIKDYENEYRPKRRKMLYVACGIAKNKWPHLEKIIGIAIDAPKLSKVNSEDFMLMDCKNWTDAQRKHFEIENEKLHFFETDAVREFRVKFSEFPREGKEAVVSKSPGLFKRMIMFVSQNFKKIF